MRGVETIFTTDAATEVDEEVLAIDGAGLTEGTADGVEAVLVHSFEELLSGDFWVGHLLRSCVLVEEDVTSDDFCGVEGLGFTDVEESENTGVVEVEAAGFITDGDFLEVGGLGDGAGAGGGLLDEGDFEGSLSSVGVAEDAEDDLVDVLLLVGRGGAHELDVITMRDAAAAFSDDFSDDRVEGLVDVVDVGSEGGGASSGDVELDELGDERFIVVVAFFDHLGDSDGTSNKSISSDEISTSESKEDTTNSTRCSS